MMGAHAAQPATPNTSSIITAWVHGTAGGIEFKAINDAARSFNSTRGGASVEIVPFTLSRYEDRVQVAAATGTLPCLLEFDGPFLAEFAWPGYLQPIDTWVSRKLRNDLLPSVVEQGTYNGRLYSLAQFDSGLGLWANRRYLNAARVRIPTIAAPWSLGEFEQALEKLAAVHGVDYPLDMAVYAVPSEFVSYAYAPILQGFGGDLIDRRDYQSARGVLDGPGSVTAMKRLQYWFKKGWTRAVPDRVDDFSRSKTALSWTGHWKYPAFKKALAEDLVLLPLPDFGHGIRTGMGSWTWGISSTCPDPAGAWAFLEYLLSPREILRMTSANGAVPSRRSALASSPLYSNNAPLQVYAKQLQAGFGVPRPATPAYGIITRSFSQAVASIIAGADVQAALSEAARKIDEEIAMNRGYPVQVGEFTTP